MKIGTRLILLFVGVTLIPTVFVALLTTQGARTALREAIGENYQDHAGEGATGIGVLLRERIHEAEQLARRPAVLAALRAANQSYAGSSGAEIIARIHATDEEWIASKGASETATRVLESEVSGYLREWTASAPKRYGEIFVTDQRGAVVGATGKLSDYYQADEQWWIEGFAGGRGAVFLDDRGLDESTQTVVIGVATPVRDGDRVVGVLKTHYNLDTLLALPLADQLPEGGRTFLARANGQVMAWAGDGAAPTVREAELAAMRVGRASWSETQGKAGLRLRAYAPVPLAIHSRMPAAGARPGISGERWEKVGWYVFVDVQSDTIFAPLTALQRLAIVATLIALLMAGLFAVATARSLSRPLQALRDSAERIAGGDLAHRLAVESSDEIGQLGESFNRMAGELGAQMAALRESEERFRLMTSNIRDYAVIMLDPLGRVVTWNVGARRLKGYDWQDINGQPMSRFYTPEDIAAGKPAVLLKQAEAEGRAEAEGWRVRKDGSRFYAEVVITAIRNETGKLLGFAKITRDITASRQAEEALRQLNEELEQRVAERTAELQQANQTMREALTTLDASLDGAFIFDAETLRFSYLNEGAVQQLGYSREELLQMTPVDIKPEIDEKSFRDMIAPLVSGDRVFLNFETIHRRKDGFDFPVEINLQYLARPGEHPRFIAIARDISERLVVEKALREREAQFGSVVSSAMDAIISVGEDMRIVLFNSAAEHMFGYPASAMQGQPMDLLIPQRLRQAHQGHVRGFAVSGITGRAMGALGAISGMRADGTEFPIEASISQTTIGGRKIFTAILRDITERKAAEEEQQQLTARLATSNEELERFAYIASHDLQEPLRTVASYLQLIERRYQDKLDESGREFIGFAVDGASRMQSLIRDLLEYSRVQTQARPFVPVELCNVLAEVLTDLKTAIEENAATVTHDPLPTIMGDAGQLRQLLQNLIGNALKYRGEPAPRIRISAGRIEESSVKRPLDAPASGWLIAVKDNGIGIEAQYFEKIFQLFQRLHTRRDYPGTGLGLALCKRIVERHGGAMWVNACPGKGSTFYVALPASV